MGHSAPVWDHKAAVELTNDWNGIDQIVLQNPQGASARVSLHGGQVTSWRSDRGEELLFTSNKEMSEHKRVRTHYSQLPEEEKEWLRARKKTLAAEWKEKESQLVLVDIQQVDDLANPIEVENLSSFSAAQIYNHRNLTAAASGSSTLQPHNRQDEYCNLFKPPKAMRGGIPICFPQCRLEIVDHLSNMDFQGTKYGPSTRILLLYTQMIRLENPLLTWYSNHLKKI